VTEPREIKRITLSRTGRDEPGHSSFAWEAELNGQQLDAVKAPPGPVLVLAGAGSGKTRVITYRVAYLIGEGRVKPQQIMLATFTNKAARSMLGRCEEVIGAAARDVTSGTFHHIANLLLRRYCGHLGYESNFTILDESDSRGVMKICRSEAGLDTKTKAFPSNRLLTAINSAMVNTNKDLDTLLNERYPHLHEFYSEIQHVIAEYHARKLHNNQMDFDDLLVNFKLLLTMHPEVRSALARRYQHVLVDEYQDVNHLQAAIVRELYLGDSPRPEQREPAADPETGLAPPIGLEDSAEPAVAEPAPTGPYNHRGLFVVGDDAQSIYSFRGADYTNIREFPSRFPDATVYKLETNYRSVPAILRLANGVLDEADPLFRKELRPVKQSSPDLPMLLCCRDAAEQSEFITEQILRLREEIGISYDDIAVLYRAHNNRLEVELECTQRNIPFVVRGGVRFFEQAHIKDLISYLVVIANSRDELAWQRMLAMCNRVGPKTIGTILTSLRSAPAEDGGALGKFLSNGAAENARGQGKASLKELQGFLRELSEMSDKLPVPDLIRTVIDQRYQGYMELVYENWRQRLDDLEQLVVYASRFKSLRGFLDDIGLNGSFSGSELSTAPSDEDREEGAVTLSTIHQAKGLEWRVVFMVHVQDDVLPHRMSQGSPEGEDEERRLFYVAVTRAEELLFMSYPQMTETRDFQRIINKPSRFLEGLPPDALEEAVLDWE